MDKGINEKEYEVRPKRIEVDAGSPYRSCQNCFRDGKSLMVYIIRYNKTDYSRENGTIAHKAVAKERELWLCEDCVKELMKALDGIQTDDEYENSLKQKIENATNEYMSLLPRDKENVSKSDALKRIELQNQIDAYKDSLITYRRLKK